MKVRRAAAILCGLALFLISGCTHPHVFTTGYPWVVDPGARIASELDGYAPDLDGWVFVLVPATYNPAFNHTYSFELPYYFELVPSSGWNGWGPDMAATAILKENEAFLDPSTTDTVSGTLVFQAPYDQLGSASVIGYGFSAEGGGPAYQVDLGFDPVPARPAPATLPKLPTAPLGTTVTVWDQSDSGCQVTVTGTRLASRSGGIAPIAPFFVAVDLSIALTDPYQCSGLFEPLLYQLAAVAEPGRPQGVDSFATAASGINQGIPIPRTGTVSATVVFDVDNLLYLVVSDSAGRQTRMDLSLDQAQHVDDIAVDQLGVPLGSEGELLQIGCTVLESMTDSEQTRIQIQIANPYTSTLYYPGQYLFLVDMDGRVLSGNDQIRDVKLEPGESATRWLSFASTQPSQLVLWDTFTMVRMELA